jgi:hypothetical protein
MNVADIYKVSRIAEAQSMRRAITASVLSKLKNVEEAKVLKQSFPRDDHAELLLKGAVSPTSTNSAISHDQISAFRSLAPASAALALFDQCVKLDLTGILTLRIPHVYSLPPQPPFVGEGSPAPAVQFTTASTTLGPARKIIVISGVTRELNEATPDTAAAVIARVLADSTNISIDKTAFDANPADATRPAGLLNGVVPLTSSTADGYTAMADDLGALAQAIGNANIDPSNIIYVCGPREAKIIQLRGGADENVLTTLGLPAKSVAAFAPAAVYSGYQDVPQIETKNEVAIHMEDTAPKELVTTPGVVAAPQKSFFQTELIAIRVRAWCAWSVAPGGAQIVNNVSW